MNRTAYASFRNTAVTEFIARILILVLTWQTLGALPLKSSAWAATHARGSATEATESRSARPPVSTAPSDGGKGSGRSEVPSRIPNQPPVVNAGPDQTIAQAETASLQGSAKDDGLPEGGTITFQWSQVSGPGTVTFGSPATAETTATFSAIGSYILRLTANDSELSASDDILVIVQSNFPNNLAPTVNAGPDQTIILSNQATLSGTVSDDGLPGNTVTITWSKLLGPGTVTFANPSAAATTATFSEAGTYTLQLTGDDGEKSASDEVVITVTTTNPNLNADFSVSGTGADSVLSLPGNFNAALPLSPSQLVNGGVIHSYSSAQGSNTPEQMLDYEFTPWQTKGLTNEWAIIQLARGLSYPVAGVKISCLTIDNASHPSHVKDFEVWVSDTTPDQTAFTKVLTASTTLSGKTETFLFPGGTVSAKYIKYVPLTPHTTQSGNITTRVFDVLTPDTVDAASSSSQLHGTTPAEAVLDTTTSTEWASAGGQVTNQWVKYRLAGTAPRKVYGVTITSGFFGPKDFDVRVSTTTSDESAFTTVLSDTVPSGSFNTPRTYLFSQLTDAKYIQFFWKNAQTTNYIGVSQLQVLAAAESGSAIVTASGPITGNSFDKVLDADTQNGIWATTGETTNQAVTLLLPNAQLWPIDRIRLEPFSQFGSDPKDFELQVSATDLASSSFTTAFSGRLVQNGGMQTFVFPQVQARFVRLLLKNNYGGSFMGLRNFQVFSAQTGGLTASFLDRSSITNGTIVAYHWDFGDGSTSTQRNPVHTYTAPGSYTVRLTVTDNQSAQATKEQVYAAQAGTSLAADFSYSPIIVYERQQVVFNDLSSPVLGGNTTRTWNWGDTTSSTSLTPSTTHIFADNGTYTVTLTVGSGTGFTYTQSRQVQVLNVAPVVTQGPHVTVVWGQPWTPTATVSDISPVDSTSLTCLWEYGDGLTSQVSNCATGNCNGPHSFAHPGTYFPKLTVRDKDGASASASTTVAVTRRPTRLNFLAVNGGTPGQPPVLRAKLEDAFSNQPIAGRTILFTVNCAVGSAVTDANGVAEINLPLPNGATWTQSTATFEEDEFYNSNIAFAGDPTPKQATQAGTDFWLMFLRSGDSGSGYDLVLDITSEFETSGTVTIPGLDFSAPFTVLANQGTRVRLPYEAMTLSSDQVENRGIHVTAQAPVTVYGLNYIPGSADSFLGLPVSVLGTTYIVTGYHNGAAFSVKGSEFGLVATLDNTKVTLTLPINQGSRLANVPYEITLNRGQVYQLTRTEANDSLDLSGSIITSDKPIGVFGGHFCTSVPANGFCDHLVEQLPSIDKWGRHFVTVPLATRPNGDIFRFVASLDDTHIAINGTQAVTLNRGQIHERLITSAAQILADKPILVVQYATGSSYGSTLSSPTHPDPADPFMMVITPYTRFTNHYIVTNPQAINLSFGGLHTHFLNIAAPVAAVGNISLDGVLIPATSFTAIGSSGYFGAQIQVAPGTHALIGSQPFGVYAYGWGFVVSYGHSGGMLFGSEVCEESLELSPTSTLSPIGTESCVTAVLRDAQNQPVANTAVAFNIVGANPQTTSIQTDASGEARFCYTGTVIGLDSITATVGNLSDVAVKQWTASGPNQAPTVDAGPDQTLTVFNINLLKNGGCDVPTVNGAIPNWTVVNGTWTQVAPDTAGFPTPNRGISYFAADGSGTAELRQDVDISALAATLTNNAQQFVFRSAVRNGAETPADLPSIVLEMLGSSGQLLQSLPVPGTSTSTSWTERTLTFNPPPSTRIIRVRLLAQRNSGATTEAWFDTLSLEDSAGQAGTFLAGSVTDDGLPNGTLSKTWSWVNAGSGGAVFFANASDPTTSAVFRLPNTYQLKLKGDDGALSAEDTVTINVVSNPCNVRITSLAPSQTTLGQTYNFTFTATGGTAPYGFVIASGTLPAGLKLSPTGVLSGVPTQSGDFPLGVVTTDATGCSSGIAGYLLKVSPIVCPDIVLSPATLPTANVGIPYTVAMTVTGATPPLTFTNIGFLPPGLLLSSAGVISGTPQVAGSTPFHVKVTDSTQCFWEHDYVLTVSNCQAITVNPASLPGGSVGSTYNQTITATGGTAPYSFSVTSGNLPAGLNLNPNGTLSGAPTTAGNVSFTVTARDASNCTGTRQYTIAIGTNQAPVVNAGTDQTVSFGNNLVRNPGNESALVNGEIPDWTEITGTEWTQASPNGDYPAAQEGQTFFIAGNAASSELRQDVDVSAFAGAIDAAGPDEHHGTQQFSFSAYVRSKDETPGDSARIRLEFLSADQSEIEFFESQPIVVTSNWALVQQIVHAPKQTRMVRIRLLGTLVTGTSNDAWFDNVALVPLQSAGALLVGTVSDDGLPNNTLATQWTKVSGPGNVTFGNPTAVATSASFESTGTYVLRLTASDSALTGADEVTVTVTGPNQPPVVSAGADQTVVLPANATLSGTAEDDGQPNNILTVSWSVVSGPNSGLVTFGDASQPATTATFSEVGSYVLRLTASDGALSQSDDITIFVNDGTNHAPTVDAGTDATIAAAIDIPLQGVVSDDGLPNNTLAIAWSVANAPVNGNVTFRQADQAETTAVFSAPGTYVLRLTADDGMEEAFDEVTFTVVDVRITSPDDGSEITTQTEIRGTVSGGSWQLQYTLDGDEEVNPNPTWTTFASGTNTVVDGPLGTFDPTLLLNGSYVIRLVLTIGQQNLTDIIGVTVTRNKKIGNFTVSFSDLSVPVTGLPIEVVRTYDSRDRGHIGDFGYGWTLSVKNIRVEKTSTAGKYWQENVQGIFGLQPPSYSLQATRSATVSLTFPNGKVCRFKPIFTPSSSVAAIQYVNISFVPADNVTHGTLVALRANGTEYDNPNGLVSGAPPEWPNEFPGGFNQSQVEILDISTLQAFNPTRFKFTDDTGIEYIVDQREGVKSIKDLNGNTVTFTANGIQHSAGKSITFVRDTQGRITQITDPMGNAMHYTYNGNGDLVSFEDRENQTTSFLYDGATHYLTGIRDPRGIQPIRNEYDADGRLVKNIDAFGKEIVYTHNLSGNEEIIHDRLGNPTRYVYDDRGNVLEKTDAEGATTTYTYDDRDNELTVTNALGKTSVMTYDALDNKLTEADPLGNTTRYTYNARRNVLTVTDPRGNVTTNTYDATGNVLTTRDALGKVTRYTYTPQGGLVRTITNALNHITTYGYDSFGNVNSETDALGHVSTSTYDPNGNRLTSTVTRSLPGGGSETITTNYQYDKLNHLTRVTFADGTFTDMNYNSIGKVSVSKDQLGRQTSYTYNDLGQLTRTTYPDGISDEATYDAEGRRLTSKDRAGRITSFEYDKVGRLLKTTAPDGTTTESTYDLLGRTLTSKDALGHTTTYEYDPNCGCAERQTRIINAFTQATDFTYDQNGNQVTMTDANNHTTTNEYDSNNRLTKVIFQDGTFRQMTYDEIGRRTEERDQAGKVTKFVYDNLGRLVKVIDALNQETRYEYNETGQQISQIDALNRTTRYEYDSLGRRTRRILPMGQFETSTYNPNGTLATRTDFNGKTTTFTYDTLNWLISKTPDASFGQAPITFTYTVTGQRATMNDASGTTTYTYDNRNRLTSKATPQGTLTYTYNAVGNVLTVRSSNANGTSVDYGYDELNRLKTVTDNRLGTTQNVTTYDYDNVGNLQSIVLPNNVTSTYTYDALNRLTNLNVNNGTTALASYAYTLGASGNRLSVAELGGRTVNYGYDNLYRLINETITGATGNSPNGQIGYTYDAVGNRTSRTSNVAGVPQSNVQVDNNDRLTTGGYDNNGSTMTSGGETYSYDFENRLTQATDSGTTISIVYDGDGNRVSKSVNDGSSTDTIEFLVDTNNHTGYSQVSEELQNGAVVRQYTFGNDLISQKQAIAGNPAVHFYGYDGHGSTRLLIDATGAKTDTYDYDAFGISIGQTGTTPNLYLYAGEQFDLDLNLYFNRARYLNIELGRFWTMDEWEGYKQNVGSLNKYLYAQNNPIMFIDPRGLYTEPFGKAAEAQIRQRYREEHPLEFLDLGTQWTKAHDLIKPDIVNFTRKSFAEVKPFSQGGIQKAGVQMALYSFVLGWYDYEPDQWLPRNQIVYPLGVLTVFFNAEGVFFYSDVVDLIGTIKSNMSLADAKELFRLGKIGSRVVSEAGRIGRLAAQAIRSGGIKLEQDVQSRMLFAAQGVA